MNQATIHWNTLIKSIRDGRCIIFIGSEIHTSESGKTLYDAIPEYLLNEGIDQFKYYKTDNLFHFDNNASKSMVISSLEDFYAQKNPRTDNILKKVAKIPFPLILSLNADNRLVKIIEESGVNPQFNFYRKNRRPEDENLKPSKFSPVIYNVFGSFTHAESLVLTYDDQFNFIKSILQTNPLPNNILSKLSEATTFLFLGVPLNTWYVRFLLREMSISNRGLSYAYNMNLKEENASFFWEQFNINVIFSEITKFVDELYKKCQEAGLIGRKDKTEDSRKAELDKVKDLIATANIDEAIDQLDKIVESLKNPEIDNQLFLIRGRQSQLIKDRIRGQIRSEDIAIRTNEIMESLLQFADNVYLSH